LAEDGSSEGVGPSGALSFAPDGNFGPCALEDVEGEFSDDGEVFRAVVLAISGPILVEADVEHPMHAVLDAPMGARAALANCSADRRAEER